MKRTTIIIGAVIIAALCALYISIRGGNETVIVNPEYDINDADYLSLYKIERADTATVLYAGVYHLPNYWILISSEIKLKDSKEKTYKLLRCEGFELDKKVFMPESGSMEFALYFEPVDKSEKEVDIIDMDENQETMTGVKLYNVKHNEPVRCVLKGEVINRPQSSRIGLMKNGENSRTAKITYIPIRDGKFEYTLYANAEEAYQLAFYDEILRSSYYSVNFIAESGTCYFTLNSVDKRDNNSIRGSKYTEDYYALTDSLKKQAEPLRIELHKKFDTLYKENKFYTPEVNAIYDEIERLSADDPKRRSLFDHLYKLQDTGADRTQEAHDLENENFRIHKTKFMGMVEYAREHPDITGYTLLIEAIRLSKGYNTGSYISEFDLSPMYDVFHDVYETKYPDHPYTATIKSYIQSATIVVGKPCPDIVLYDDEGNNVHLSKLIKGKVALVHLWASWCSPCRRHGKEMIPIYEMYKDKGFTIVSIAREQRREAMTAAVKQDRYPWTTFLDLNGRSGIWTAFGIDNYAGGDFLIDAQGNFLAIMTSPKEVKEMLQKQLKIEN